MSATALLLKEAGYAVTGSDAECYGPPKATLKNAGIVPALGYRPENIPHDADEIVIGRNAKLAPGENTRLPFSFAALSPLGSGVRIKNPVITLNAVADANHLGSDGVFKKINIESSQVAKIMSDVELAARAVYYEGPFGNIGPMPPKAEQETTYTIFWTIVNTANDLRSVTVSAQLPQYMRWTGATSPSGESVSYDPDTRMVMWRAGDVVAWRGVASLPREVVFQVGLLPSVSQIGRAPVLAEEASLSAVDEFTDSSLADTSPAVTTNLIADSRFVSGNAEVTQ